MGEVANSGRQILHLSPEERGVGSQLYSYFSGLMNLPSHHSSRLPPNFEKRITSLFRPVIQCGVRRGNCHFGP